MFDKNTDNCNTHFCSIEIQIGNPPFSALLFFFPILSFVQVELHDFESRNILVELYENGSVFQTYQSLNPEMTGSRY